MAATVVVNIVVGPLVKIVLEKASNYLLDKYKVMKGMEEQHEILKRRLPAILDVIADAEQAAAHREGAAAWLQAIKKVTYQANEVFDEFKYEALRRKAKKEGHYKELGFSVVKLFPTHNRFIFRNRMGRKLRKIVRAIEVLVAEMKDFDFKHQQPLRAYNQWRQKDHDIFDPEKITSRSRAKDKKKLVDILVGQANNADLTVVPIVGMGGLGKTTLAQLVYNDTEIQKHFNLLLWVCVSDNFDVDSLAKSIVEAALEKNGAEAATSMRTKTPLDGLQNVVSGQRYLLVLDDVWTREVHKWEQLKACLERGGMGSVVLTTTRDKGVAEIVGTVEAYNLGALDGQYIKEIIETMSFSCLKKGEERPAVLMNMVDEIVERCSGSPLAAMALGSVLRNKTSEEEWKDVSSRSNICTVESGILPILKLSYNDLPPQMKQCFAFCAIFPKDYEINVDKLIQLWIAHGFIIQEKQVRLENIGKQIFNELVSRSFFQDVKQVQTTIGEIEQDGACYVRSTCKIHDLMHDVALSVMENECALATEDPGKIGYVFSTEEPSQSEWLPDTARHLFLSCKEPARKLNSSLKNSSSAIQTLLCDSFMSRSLHHLAKYSSLQALQLRLLGSFPLKPKHLHHLRYLDLSRSLIKALPEDMSILYNLQTLNLSGCVSLRELPRQMKYMAALRHLYTHGCPELKGMPRDLRKLTSLQTLTCFVAGSGSNCSNVGELGNLNLGGQLELHHLENVTEEAAKAANLVMKKEVTELTLKWTVGSDNVVDEPSSRDDAKVLEELKPHDGLHAIRIHTYGGTTFPTWTAMLQNIVVIHISHCKKLQWFFSGDINTSFAFPNLKELTLQELVCFERWWEIDNVTQGEVVMFPRLEKLRISQCEKLTALPGQPTFPNLQITRIERCPELTTRVESPKLSVLKMEGHDVQLFQWVARHMTSLTNVELHSLVDSTETTSAVAEDGLREVLDCKEKWNDHDFPLTVLVLQNFKSGITELCSCFVHLQDLSVWRCHALLHWPEKEFEGLVSLRKLVIHQCENLTDMHKLLRAINIVRKESAPSTSRVTSDKECESLVEVFNVPASLRVMEILYCKKLESISGRRLLQGQSASSIHQGPSSIAEVSSSPSSGVGVENLETLKLVECHSLTGVLRLPSSLKVLDIDSCSGLTSLESHSGELPSLEYLYLWSCNKLSSLLDGPRAYSYLQSLYIKNCPGIKAFPTSLQQRLGSIQEEYTDAHYYGNKPRPIPILLKPKTWKCAIRRD
ncbi:LOW QUALITY PROTEIN: disease resistance protein RGA2 [Aegilops tauschii subsp. strangulata]|uniref:LOW QUALITY PROTEIN: disease resistance protein RGA2 n=1 Tax=Aegilops tauschii subsp. strangulata TaxID=200361 RepID=UPI003CC8A61C